MNASNEEQPIIIVRRRRMEEDGHHGGAWKIAFADFMTAMMALFLVLWLVNASDDETRKAVASYFNPVELVDRQPSRRGLAEPDGKTGEEAPEAEAPEAEGERAFRNAPETVLAEREAEARQADVETPPVTPADVSLAAELRPADPFAADLSGASELRTGTDGAGPTDGETENLAAELRDAVRAALPNDAALPDAVHVEAGPRGTVVRLTDGPAFAMFGSNSFVPTGRTVVALKAVAGVLASRPGGIRLEGHTDAVPVRGGGDNWRLSTERAHAARLMLARGGLDVSRIVAVSGHAAARPLPGLDPRAAGNRRIEIVLESP